MKSDAFDDSVLTEETEHFILFLAYNVSDILLECRKRRMVIKDASFSYCNIFVQIENIPFN